MELKNHDLVDESRRPGVGYDEIPLRDGRGETVDGLHTVRITLENPAQHNSYTTDMIKGVILGMRQASNDRGCVAVVCAAGGASRSTGRCGATVGWRPERKWRSKQNT